MKKYYKKHFNQIWSSLKNIWLSFNNQSLFIKVGCVIALLSAIIGTIVIVLFLQLKRIEKTISSPNNTYLIATLYIQQQLLQTRNDLKINNKMHIKKAQEILKTMLFGGQTTYSLDNGNPVFLAIPKLDDEYGRKYLENVLHRLKSSPTEKEIDEALRKLCNFSLWIMKKELHEREKLIQYLSQKRKIENFLIIILLIVLLCGGISFFLMVLLPLRTITKRVYDIGHTEWAHSDLKLLSFPFNDEIGKLVKEVNNLIKYFDEIGNFKRLLEEENSVQDVYERLGHLLYKRFNIQKFVIYAVSNSQNNMKPVYIHPKDLKINQEILMHADLCRAKRAGRTISSIEIPKICKLFLHENAEHICIPLVCGGKIEGVVQLIIPKDDQKEVKRIESSMSQLNAFLEESIPVIEAKRFAEHLQEISIKDQLTGLYNRRFLDQALENIVAGILRRNTVLGVLMCDIDYFKEINDIYGHDVGDEILKEVARILKENVRKADIVARFGGEELIILLVDIRKGEAAKVAEKLCNKIAETKFETKVGVLRKTISIGVSEFPVDSEKTWQTIKFADVALYKAKELGRNRVVKFEPYMWTEDESLY
jgi:diguanylate cyclase (GGDEF)-like protein